jgi:hypothetical protein
MNSTLRISLVLAGAVALCHAGAVARAATASAVTGFYYTGENSAGGLLSQGSGTLASNSGTQDPYWTVTYASTNGGATAASANIGTAYVVNTTSTTYGSQFPSGYWANNTSKAQWITAPGAVFTNGNGASSSNVNAGGDGLYGYGTGTAAMNATNAAIYIYTTTFTISGNGTAGTAVTGFTLNLQLSADNSFDVFVNPASTTAVMLGGTAKYVSGANAYTASSAVALTSGFVIGVNTISVEVQNAYAASSGSINYSGLLVYGAGFSGLVVPEVGTWLPLVGAAALYGGLTRRPARRRIVQTGGESGGR